VGLQVLLAFARKHVNVATIAGRNYTRRHPLTMSRPRRRREAVTAEELKARLSADPLWQAKMAGKERALRPIIEQNRQAAAPIVADLVAAGFYVHSIADLHHQRLNYRRAIPILLKWLPRVENADVKESIIRALSVKWSPPEVGRIVIEEYRKGVPADTSWRWAIGNALTVLAGNQLFEDIVELARDGRYGNARQRVVESLANMTNPRSVDILIELLDDAVVRMPAVRALGKLGARARAALPRIEDLLNHPEAWVRKEALSALKRIKSA
jgi:HEAT repeat protein